MKISEHVSLVIFWILFSILHSVFATGWWKERMRKWLGESFKFYRFYYSVFATINLAAILYFQFTIVSPLLWNTVYLIHYAGLIATAAGMIVMMACMRKYILVVTGVRAFSNSANSRPVLQTGGLHKYTRHPLYLGTLVFIWGIFLISPKISHLICCVAMSVYTLAGIFFEEKKLVVEFGEEYTRYASEVPRLLPRFLTKGSKQPYRKESKLILPD